MMIKSLAYLIALLLVMVQQGTACRYPASLVIFYHNSSAEKSPKKKYSNEIICNKIHRPATKHIVNIIIFFTPLYFFFLNKKSSNSEIAMSIIFIAPAIISIVYNFVVITNGLQLAAVRRNRCMLPIYFYEHCQNPAIISLVVQCLYKYKAPYPKG